MEFVPTDEELKEIKQLIEIEDIADDLDIKKKFDAKIYYLNNKEKYKQYYENRKAKMTQIEKVVIVCPVCKGSYFENHLARHIKTKSHKFALKVNEKQYFDEVEELLLLFKPDQSNLTKTI